MALREFFSFLLQNKGFQRIQVTVSSEICLFTVANLLWGNSFIVINSSTFQVSRPYR